MTEMFVIPAKEGRGKSHRFSVFALGFGLANDAWKPLSISPDRRRRPVYIAFAAMDQQARAFRANLLKSRPFQAIGSSGNVEADMDMPKSAGYRWAEQRVEGGVTIMTATLPEVMALDPGGIDAKRIRFVFAPPCWWVAREASRLAAAGEPHPQATARGAYFAAMLDRRTARPIISDPAFYRQLWARARTCGWYRVPSGTCYSPGGVFVWPQEDAPLGLMDFALVDVSHAEFDAVLAEETGRYAASNPEWLRRAPVSITPAVDIQEEPLGPNRVPSGSRLLPVPRHLASQLELFG